MTNTKARASVVVMVKARARASFRDKIKTRVMAELGQWFILRLGPVL